jgi:hypothetical protein
MKIGRGILKGGAPNIKISPESVGGSLMEGVASRDGRFKSVLIGATVGSEIIRATIGNETALQLRTPVWQCNAERLIQAGVMDQAGSNLQLDDETRNAK